MISLIVPGKLIPSSCLPLAEIPIRKFLASYYLDIAVQCQPYFPACEVPRMLETFLPLFTLYVSYGPTYLEVTAYIMGSENLDYSQCHGFLHSADASRHISPSGIQDLGSL